MIVAATHGFVSGAYYGAWFGLAVGIYKRKISPIYRYAGFTGATYSGLLASSNYFRIDV